MEKKDVSLVDAGDGYFFERLKVDHSVLKSLVSALKTSSANFHQVTIVYSSIAKMEKKCTEKLEQLNSLPGQSNHVEKLASINLCEDMLHSSDREIAIVKTVMSSTNDLIEEAEKCVAKYEETRNSFTNLKEIVGLNYCFFCIFST